MAELFVYVLAFIGLVALIATVVAVLADDDADLDERALIEFHVRSAERRLHDIARTSFERMLDEARAHRSPEVK
jgi:hypothetical protein